MQGQTTASSRTRPSHTASRVTPTSVAPGTWSMSVVVITDCPCDRRTLDERVAAISVQLAHHVVEQHQRNCVPFGGDRLALGQQQRQQRQPLLTLGAIGTELAAAVQHREVIAVRPVAGEATVEVAVHALGELLDELVGHRRPRSRAVAGLGFSFQSQ